MPLNGFDILNDTVLDLFIREVQRVLLGLALEIERLAGFAGIPDGMQRLHVLPHLRGRLDAPRHAVSTHDVGTDLRSEPVRIGRGDRI
jgi:hypothetical protein